MKKFNMYCVTMEPNHFKAIKELNYIPVGLGEKDFLNGWVRDNTGENISYKNKYYGEYTFHYWLWKNYLEKIDNKWIGFCQYRKFWTIKEESKLSISLDRLSSLVLKEIPEEYQNYDVILGEPMFINQLRIMKFLKRGFKLTLKNPSYFFNKNKRTIKFHFDMWHGENYLSEAIRLLDKENRDGFNDFVNKNFSFNPHNMFICKSKNLLKKYYTVVFTWLKKCEDLFGFDNLVGYGQTRIYGFLAERFMSYWFQNNAKFKTMPIIFYDIKKDLN